MSPVVRAPAGVSSAGILRLDPYAESFGLQMKRLSRIVACALGLLAGISPAIAQTTSAATSDPAITALSVMGVVADLRPDTHQVIVKTAAGNQVTVTLSDRTDFLRIPPGEKTKDKFIKITAADFTLGDSVFARGRMSEDRKNLPALEFYVMSKGEIAQKRQSQRDEWRTRGVAGTVNALNAETKEISLDSRTPSGPKPVVIVPNADAKFRRYAPDSVRYSDAKQGSFADLKVGDQLRALGTKSDDGGRLKAEEIVSGSFQTIGGTITEVHPESSEIKINDSQNHQQITIIVKKDSSMRRLTPELLAALTPGRTGSPDASPSPTAAPPANTNAAKGAADLQEMFDQLPTFTLKELKPGDSILVSSTSGATPTSVTAIAVVSGVGPLLENAQGARKTAVALGAMSLGGP